MTPEMMQRAIQNSKIVSKNLGYQNVEFRQGFLEEVPMSSDSVDVLTSNCVVNLSPDKKKVFKEIYRILKDGGRFVISDIVSEIPVPDKLKKDKKLWGECISGALTEKEFLSIPKDVGFYGMEILNRTFYREVEGFQFWSVGLRSWKNKKEPKCIYIGQYAIYLGPFSQVSDDENHTYNRGIPFEICTGTAVKLMNSPYKEQFIISDSKNKGEVTKVCTPIEGSESSCC